MQYARDSVAVIEVERVGKNAIRQQNTILSVIRALVENCPLLSQGKQAMSNNPYKK
jgi:hypothetical protein